MFVLSGIVTSATKDATLHGMNVLVAFVCAGGVEVAVPSLGIGVDVLISVGGCVSCAAAVIVCAASVKIKPSPASCVPVGRLQADRSKISTRGTKINFRFMIFSFQRLQCSKAQAKAQFAIGTMKLCVKKKESTTVTKLSIPSCATAALNQHPPFIKRGE